ncbi:terpene cyclase/mutase family protein [Blastopirellula sp. J2-11]|uniref:terpene cyclase/mutase family protein n=1 Tax=Blastopirellula sp. J2-11 TaxID=2943192 RepID=UPI0021C8410C|nr:terpene cyclase/mutase family protein [Blastopirellula sp. J2-11]UUO08981.1 terpene cyclase/mutase family protein [Blastopirellula sp. J2-11]
MSHPWWGALFLALFPTVLCAYSPESPEVETMVQKGAGFLKSTGVHDRPGGKALVALALLKAGEKESHPRVQSGVDAARSLGSKTPSNAHDNAYDVGMSLILLCELDPEANREPIQNLLQYFLDTQKPGGGWGYAGRNTGDNSMTQYGALGLWLSQRSGFEVPIPTVERLCNWILRCQDPSGGWGYQGVDPGPGNFQRVQQVEMRPTMVCAALGSLYMGSDLLNITERRKQDVEEKSPSLPGFVREVKTPDAVERSKILTKAVDAGRVTASKNAGRNNLAATFTISPNQWDFYYLYALERYESFRELDLGKKDPKPAWYDAGVNHLRSTQANTGSWRGKNEEPMVATAFAILFLKRSTAQSIKKRSRVFDEGRLVGGRGLPKVVEDATIKNGQVVNKSELLESDKFLSMIEADDAELERFLHQDVKFELSEDERGRSEQIVQLRRKIREGSFGARLLAIRAIRQSKDFDSIPALIYALTDPDVRVAIESRDALRFITRKFNGFGMPRGADLTQRSLYANQWKQWYRSVRPDAEFLD